MSFGNPTIAAHVPCTIHDVTKVSKLAPVLSCTTYPLIPPASVASFQVNVISPVVNQLPDIGETNTTLLGAVISALFITKLRISLRVPVLSNLS